MTPTFEYLKAIYAQPRKGILRFWPEHWAGGFGFAVLLLQVLKLQGVEVPLNLGTALAGGVTFVLAFSLLYLGYVKLILKSYSPPEGVVVSLSPMGLGRPLRTVVWVGWGLAGTFMFSVLVNYSRDWQEHVSVLTLVFFVLVLFAIPAMDFMSQVMTRIPEEDLVAALRGERGALRFLNASNQRAMAELWALYKPACLLERL